MDVLRLFIQNEKVNEFNKKGHTATSGEKFSIKVVESVVEANSVQLRDKILSQIPENQRKQSKLL